MLYVVRMHANAALAACLEKEMEAAGIEATCWQHADTGEAQFEQYFETRPAAEQGAQELDACRKRCAGGADGQIDVAELPESAWRDAWKAFFRTEQVSPNIVVRPPWEPATHAVRCLLEINPGLSFGTGRHFTTRSCLQALDRLSERWPGASLVDVGCGSGILAIAAVKLGFTRVTAIDNDPQAMQCARENAAQNGVGANVIFQEAGLETLTAPQPFGVVAANLYEELLRRYADRLIALLAPGREGGLLLSGMLCEQYAAVRAAYADRGFAAEQVWEDHEWTTALLTRSG